MIIKIYNLIIRFYLFVKYHIAIKGTILKCKLDGLKNNMIDITGYLSHSNLHIKGSKNSISLKGELLGCDIRVFGNNCKLIIEDGCKLQTTSIWLRGNNAEIRIGKDTDIHPNARIVCHGNGNYIKIGASCMFSSEVNIWNSDTHPIYNNDGIVINPSKPIIIGNHVWICRNASISKGVNIGDNSIVGMNTLVTKSVKENVIVAGVPQKIIKENICWDSSKIETVDFML